VTTAMIRRKKKSTKGRYSDEAFTGSEPDWTDSDKWSAERYYRERSRTSQYYSYYYKTKDFISWVADWMLSNGYTKEDVTSYKAAPEWRTRATLGGSVRALSRGMPDNHKGIPEYFKTMSGIMNPEKGLRDVSEEVRNDINEIIEIGKKIKIEKEEEQKTKVKKKRLSIQELLEKKSIEMAWDIDDFVYDYDGSKEMLAKFNPQKLLLVVGAKPNHAKVISKLYEPMFNEFDELLNPPDIKKMSDHEKDMHGQLKEGYSHMSKSEIKNHYKMFKMIGDACENIILKGKATRKPRKKKLISKEKQIKNFKYLDHHADTKSISVHPTELIGANGAVVYNSKTRKLGIYHARNIDPMGLKREGSGLSVKGTTIKGFSEEKSVCKTLRKPLDQLAVFKKGAKRTIIKEFDAINSVEIKMNGRCNVHCLIIKVF